VDNGPGRGARRQTLSPKPPRARTRARTSAVFVTSADCRPRTNGGNTRALRRPVARALLPRVGFETRCIARPACVVVLDDDREPLEDSDRKNLTLRDRAERSRLARGLFALTCYWISAKYLISLNL